MKRVCDLSHENKEVMLNISVVSLLVSFFWVSAVGFNVQFEELGDARRTFWSLFRLVLGG